MKLVQKHCKCTESYSRYVIKETIIPFIEPSDLTCFPRDFRYLQQVVDTLLKIKNNKAELTRNKGALVQNDNVRIFRAAEIGTSFYMYNWSSAGVECQC